jgi:hypothetical protein
MINFKGVKMIKAIGAYILSGIFTAIYFVQTFVLDINQHETMPYLMMGGIWIIVGNDWSQE